MNRTNHRAATFAALFAPLTLGALLLSGACSSSTPKPGDESGRDEFAGEARDTEIKHEPCEPGGHTIKTFNADDPHLSTAKAYVTHVYDGGKEVCWFADLNGDGRVDVYTYFDASGVIRRREAGYTVSNAIDEISTYKAGALEVVARDTSFDGRLDTWDYYENNRLVRRERDKTGEGRVDEWWTFEGNTDNVTIIQADPRTGKPDPTQALKINVGFTASQPPPPPSYTKPKGDAGVGGDVGIGGDAGKAPPAPTGSTLPATDGTFPDGGKKGSK